MNQQVRKLTISAVVLALYVVIMAMTQGFAFGQYQIRIATALYALGALYPFLMLPLALANLLSNALLGGLGVLDMAGGFCVGILATGATAWIRKQGLPDWMLAIPVIFVPGLLVPIWLSVLIHVPYAVLAVSLVIGQLFPGVTGVLLVKQLAGWREKEGSKLYGH